MSKYYLWFDTAENSAFDTYFKTAVNLTTSDSLIYGQVFLNGNNTIIEISLVDDINNPNDYRVYFRFNYGTDVRIGYFLNDSETYEEVACDVYDNWLEFYAYINSNSDDSYVTFGQMFCVSDVTENIDLTHTPPTSMFKYLTVSTYNTSSNLCKGYVRSLQIG